MASAPCSPDVYGTARDEYPAKTLSELLKRVIPLYDVAIPEEQDTIARTVISELTLSQDTAQYKVKSGFVALESRFIAVSGLATWLSELPMHHDAIIRSIDELTVVMPQDIV